MYSFVSQILPFVDPELEKLYVFVRFLLRKLPPSSQGGVIPDLDEEIALKAYRLEKTADNISVSLTGVDNELTPPQPGGGQAREDEKTELSRLVEAINEKFAGITWTAGDTLFVDAVVADVSALADIRQKAKVNDFGNFVHGFMPAIENAMIDRMENNGDIVARYLDDPEFKRLLGDYMARQVYDGVRAACASMRSRGPVCEQRREPA